MKLALFQLNLTSSAASIGIFFGRVLALFAAAICASSVAHDFRRSEEKRLVNAEAAVSSLRRTASII